MLIFHSEVHFASIIMFLISRKQLCYLGLCAKCINLGNTNVVCCHDLVMSSLEKRRSVIFRQDDFLMY